MAHYSDAPMVSLPRPGRALKGVLIGLLALWLMFAVGINWAGVPEELFLLFCGNAQQILQGEVWRLFTAPLMHQPTGTISRPSATSTDAPPTRTAEIRPPERSQATCRRLGRPISTPCATTQRSVPFAGPASPAARSVEGVHERKRAPARIAERAVIRASPDVRR
jgi:hypothetical protein